MAKKTNTKRKIIALVSELTGHKLELMKYDPKARKHAKYVETKKNLGRNEVKAKKH
jgi:large subunit ribosomal protein L33